VNDPHVEALRYRLAILADGVDFDRAPPLDADREGFRFALDKGKLIVTPADHYPSEREARDAVESILRAWEIDHALRSGRPEIRFEFEWADVIDRDPPPPPKPGDDVVLGVRAALSLESAVGLSISVSQGRYPEPPTGFATDDDVEMLYAHWSRYLDGGELLQHMAYFCLTVLERHGGRADGARRFGISSKVVDTLGRLSSNVGDPATARKATAAPRPLTPAEGKWLEEAVKLLVRRAGEVAANPGATLPQITMADLPKL
jgi:hypothetical protein